MATCLRLWMAVSLIALDFVAVFFLSVNRCPSWRHTLLLNSLPNSGRLRSNFFSLWYKLSLVHLFPRNKVLGMEFCSEKKAAVLLLISCVEGSLTFYTPTHRVVGLASVHPWQWQALRPSIPGVWSSLWCHHHPPMNRNIGFTETGHSNSVLQLGKTPTLS